jgi:hypothetical protein
MLLPRLSEEKIAGTRACTKDVVFINARFVPSARVSNWASSVRVSVAGGSGGIAGTGESDISCVIWKVGTSEGGERGALGEYVMTEVRSANEQAGERLDGRLGTVMTYLD